MGQRASLLRRPQAHTACDRSHQWRCIFVSKLVFCDCACRFVHSQTLISLFRGFERESVKSDDASSIGAGGVDLMFNKRASDELALLKDVPSSTRLIKVNVLP